MRTIGLLGGMSWESSVEYERLINTEVRRRIGGTASASLLLRSYDFSEIEALQEVGDWDEAGRVLAGDASALVTAGAEIIILCTNTMHRVAPAIEAAISVPFIHIADPTAEAIHGAGLGTAGLLGTRYTMEQEFYVDRLRKAGIEVIIPDEPDRTLVHDVIFEELVQGIASPTSKRAYVGIIERLVDRGAQGIIAGCTEIELLVTPDDVAVPYFPTTSLHAHAAVEASLQ